MEQLLKEQDRLEKKANLSKSIKEVQAAIDKLKNARESLQADSQSASMTFAKLQNPIKKHFDGASDNLKEIHSAQTKYSKALAASPLLKNNAANSAAKDPATGLPIFGDSSNSSSSTTGRDALSSQSELINRAIAMHLLREGHFEVAQTFVDETKTRPLKSADNSTNSLGHTAFSSASAMATSMSDPSSIPSDLQSSRHAWEQGLVNNSSQLQKKFERMYEILGELRSNGNLTPAIDWARQNSSVLESRGSNLEFDLCRLQFISLYTSGKPEEGILAAIDYARRTFPSFPPRYESQVRQLLGSLAFVSDLPNSPYSKFFCGSSSNSSDIVSEAMQAFQSEFCALLQLSSASPLLTAVTAGCIALPTLVKFSAIQAAKRTSWTTSSELPVGVPLPPGYQFHSIFVCPVSKEQSTDDNPPMMMPCGHVIAQESMERMSRGGRFKCPYCPQESHQREALRLYF